MTKQTKKRPTRKPISSRSALSSEQRPGYVRRWVNDQEDRINMFKEAGYTPVVGNADTSTPDARDPNKIGSIVRKHVGGGTYAVLMEIPEEFYKEDQEAKQHRVDEIEESYDPTKKIVENTYGIKMKRIYGGRGV